MLNIAIPVTANPRFPGQAWTSLERGIESSVSQLIETGVQGSRVQGRASQSCPNMAEPLRGLHPVAEGNNEDAVSAVLPSPASSARRSNASPVKDFFRRTGYQRMPSDGVQEMANLSKAGAEADPSSSSSSPLSYQLPPLQDGDSSGLGITEWSHNTGGAGTGTGTGTSLSNRNSILRKPLSVKGTPPDTPRSHHALLGSESSSPAMTPGLPRGAESNRSSHLRTKDSWGEMGASLGGGGGGSSSGGGAYRHSSRDSDARNLLDTPTVGSSAQGTPGPLDPRGEVSEGDDGDYDDALFNKGFGKQTQAERGRSRKRRTSLHRI